MRNSRTGNRQINMALHRIALTQIRVGAPGAEYYRKRINDGDTPTMARRCLKRHLARAVYRRLLKDRKRTTIGDSISAATPSTSLGG
jgi:transposase